MADIKPAKNKVSPVKYVGQVRQEARKVVWPTSRETITTTILGYGHGNTNGYILFYCRLGVGNNH